MLNDKDKEYLKNGIEKKIDNLGNRVGKAKPETEAGKRLNELIKQDQEKEDRLKLLEELQKRDQKGETTLAQKIEMLNLAVKTAIPQDFKDGMKAMSETMKKGGKQAMSGVSHLTERLMMTNPLTAMIWQNRDILKALGDVGLGTLKMGWGAAKGIGTGAAGILKSAVNMFKKKDKPVTTKENTETSENIEIKEEPSETANSEELIIGESDGEKSTAQKISEMHEFMFSDAEKKEKQKLAESKEQKGFHAMLSKGLGGLGKTMKAVSGFIEIIMAKQKMILAGLMIGAVAVLSLVGWFKGGGFEDLLNSKLNPKHKHNKKNDIRADLLSSVVTSSPFSGEQLKETFTEQAQKMGQLKGGEISSDTKTGKTQEGIEYTKKVNAKAVYKNDGKRSPVLAPYDGKCTHIRFMTRKSNGKEVDRRFQIQITPKKKDSWTTGEGSHQRMMGGVLQNHDLIFHNIIEPQITKGQTFSKGYILGFADEDLKITAATGFAEQDEAMLSHYLEKYNTQLEEAKNENYASSIDITAKEKTQDRTDKLKSDIVHMAKKSNYALNKGFGDNIADVWDRFTYAANLGDTRQKLKEQIFDENKSFNVDNPEKPSITTKSVINDELVDIPKGTPQQKTENEDKLKNQNAQLKEMDEKQREIERRNNQPAAQQNTETPKISVIEPAKSMDIQPSGVFNTQGALASMDTNFTA